jgi:hypothetical protein
LKVFEPNPLKPGVWLPPPASKKNKLTGIVEIRHVVTVTYGPGLKPVPLEPIGALGAGMPTGTVEVVVLTG